MSNDINLTEGTITEVLNDKVDIDFNNVPSNSVGFARCSTEVTNCITEIPQRIKVEFKDETLTLKAGSVVTIPNGEGVFNEVTISNDISEFQNTAGTSRPNLCFVDKEGRLWLIKTDQCFSGATKPTATGQWMVWYDTVNNVINFYQSTTDYNTITTTFSLPFAIGTTKGDGTYHFTSIDQVFNGMGYIGSTIWVDKGVKGLVPNGRNEDGSLKNEEWNTDKLIIRTFESSKSGNNQIIAVNSNRPVESITIGMLPMSGFCYDPKENRNYQIGTNLKSEWRFTPIAVNTTLTNGVISNFNPNFTLNLTDLSDGQWVLVDKRIATSVSLNSSTNFELDISDILPNDGYDYECSISADVLTNGYVQMVIKTDLGFCAQVAELAGADFQNKNARANTILPVGTGRKIYVLRNNYDATFGIRFEQYRRIGKNV